MKKNSCNFSRASVIVLSLAFAVFSYSTAYAVAMAPTFNFTYNGVDRSGDLTAEFYGEIMLVNNPNAIILDGSPEVMIPEYSFSFLLKSDPFLCYSIFFNNTSNEIKTLGNISISGPIFMSSPENKSSASLDGSIIDARQISFLRVDDTSPWINAGVDVALGESVDSVPGPVDNWSFIRIDLTGLSIPVGESLVEGEFMINPVPLPPAFFLFASGLVGLLGFGARKR